MRSSGQFDKMQQDSDSPPKTSDITLPAIKSERRLSFDLPPFHLTDSISGKETMPKRNRHNSETNANNFTTSTHRSSLCPSPPQKQLPNLSSKKKLIKRSVSVPEGGMRTFLNNGRRLSTDKQRLQELNNHMKAQAERELQTISAKVDDFCRRAVTGIPPAPVQQTMTPDDDGNTDNPDAIVSKIIHHNNDTSEETMVTKVTVGRVKSRRASMPSYLPSTQQLNNHHHTEIKAGKAMSTKSQKLNLNFVNNHAVSRPIINANARTPPTRGDEAASHDKQQPIRTPPTQQPIRTSPTRGETVSRDTQKPIRTPTTQQPIRTYLTRGEAASRHTQQPTGTPPARVAASHVTQQPIRNTISLQELDDETKSGSNAIFHRVNHWLDDVERSNSQMGDSADGELHGKVSLMAL